MTLKETILQEANAIFQREGLQGQTETSIQDKIDISQATFSELFRDFPDMVSKVVAYDLHQQKEHHKYLLATSPNAVSDIMLLLQHGINRVKQTHPLYYQQLQQNYPQAWQLALGHLSMYSYPQVHDIINKGILEGNFRRDINIPLVTKIMMEQLNLMLNPLVFPPDRYDLAEVFRSIYLYYVRGLCTDNGSKQAEDFFARNQF